MTTDPATCPTCARAIAPDAPGGACPACLLGAGIATGGRVAEVPNMAGVQARFADYEILGLLGRGGMGVVWKARHRALDPVVALKVLPAEAAAQAGFSDRFQREARALARLEHPNIVGVHEFGVRDGTFFLVMEYVDGLDMRRALREGRIGPADALRIVPQICDALQYAHDHGVVHRDIKPENVLIDAAGRVKVADFGLAKIVAGDASPQDLTVTGQVMGTPHYMAPEQFEKPTTVDHRADIYSLGVVFYEMLTGELPLGRFPPPSQKFQVDVRFDEVVLRSLQKQPELRWQHASDVKSEVGVIAAGPAPAPATAGTRAGRIGRPPPPEHDDLAAAATRRRRLGEAVGCLTLLSAWCVATIASPVPDVVRTAAAVLAIVVGVAMIVVVTVMRRTRMPVGLPPLTRLSHLAVAGAVVVMCGGLAVRVLALAAKSAAGPLPPSIIAAGTAVFALVGLVISFVAYVRIRRSKGGLYGIAWATVGTFAGAKLLCETVLTMTATTTQ